MTVQVRLKVKDWFSIRALPNQIVKVNKRWQLGNSPVALRVNYECPLDNLANPLRAPARLMVRWGSTHCVPMRWRLPRTSQLISAWQNIMRTSHSAGVGREDLTMAPPPPAHESATHE